MQRRLIFSSFPYLSSHFCFSGAKTVHRLASSMATRPQAARTQRILRPRARTSRSIARDRGAPCHPKVSGIGGSYNIGNHTLIRGQDRAPVDNPLPSPPKLASAGLKWRSPISRCPAAPADTVVVANPSSSGDSPTRATSTRTALVATKASRLVARHPVFPCLRCSILTTCLVV